MLKVAQFTIHVALGGTCAAPLVGVDADTCLALAAALNIAAGGFALKG